MLFRPATLLLALPLFGACNQLGSSAIRNGRGVYNQSIIDSSDRQTLSMIVRLRYGESLGMLAVNAVTANVRMRASASADLQFWGTDSQVAGNLVPFGANIAYEENPTISYTPIDGAEYVREMLSPIPIDLAFLLLDARPETGNSMITLLESINGVSNPAFFDDPHQRDGRFNRLVELAVELERAGAMHWVRLSREGSGFALVISRYAPGCSAAVTELLELVGVSSDVVEAGRDVILQTWLSDGTTDRSNGLAVRTRSIFDLMRIAAAAMDVPPEHLESGWAEGDPAVGAAADLIRIRRSKSAPKAAMVAVEHHGWWYYIDAGDSASKGFFRLLQTLISVRIAESAKTNAQLPVLTVPVTR